jgi:uncharacterized protein YbjT (DUF2867 family)
VGIRPVTEEVESVTTGSVQVARDPRRALLAGASGLVGGELLQMVLASAETTIAKAGSVEQLQKVDRDYVRDFGAVAKKAGAERLSVVSALGADPRSINYYNRTKGEMEALLAEMDFPSLRIFRPSLLLGERQERRPKEMVAGLVLGALSPVMVGPLVRYRGVAAAQVARAMYVTSLEDFSGVRIFESDEIQNY